MIAGAYSPARRQPAGRLVCATANAGWVRRRQFSSCLRLALPTGRDEQISLSQLSPRHEGPSHAGDGRHGIRDGDYPIRPAGIRIAPTDRTVSKNIKKLIM